MAIKVDVIQQPWPTFTDAQVAFLEKLYPVRCLQPHEMVEDHLRHAGKVDLIALLRAAVPGSSKALEFNEDEEEALDVMAAELVQEQKQE